MRPRSGGQSRRVRLRGKRCEAGPAPHLIFAVAHGQAVVETALVVPLLFAMVAAIVTFGRVYGAYQTVAVASHDGARSVATGGSAADGRQVALEALAVAGLDAGATVSVEGSAALAGEAVTVVVAVSVSNALPFPGVPDPVVVAARTVMRKE